jgi:hypothetical protein
MTQGQFVTHALAAARDREMTHMAAYAAAHPLTVDMEPSSVTCRVPFEGHTPADGHIERLHGIGWTQTQNTARQHGWVEVGGQWTGPACAQDSMLLHAFSFQPDDGVGPIIFTSAGALLTELSALLEEWARCPPGDDERMTVRAIRLTRGQLNTLREFDGY